MTLPDRFYVTGTDTDVGKTVACAALCAAGGYDYLKPIQSGVPGDSETVAALSGVRTWPERWRLRRPASPHAAAGDEGIRIALSELTLPPAPRLVVEGVGGWLAPLATQPALWQSDLVRALGLPVLVVARSGLGTLNHTLLTLRALRADGAIVLGVLLTGPAHAENERDLPRLSGVPVLGRLPRVDDPAAELPALTAAVRHLL
jgi:dethiobiotin synthase